MKSASSMNRKRAIAWLIGAMTLGIVGIIGAYMGYRWYRHAHRHQVAYSKSHYDGIDVSHHNGTIRWGEVAKEKRIQFVYIKATEGRSRKDHAYKRNIRRARAQGLRCGAYHFMSSRSSAKDQFANFASVVDKQEMDLIPVIDIEPSGCKGWSRSEIRENLREFIRLCKEHYGVSPIIYTSEHFYNMNLAPDFNRYYLFIASYSPYRPMVLGKGSHDIWQYSERGSVRGIDSYVDLDRFTSKTGVEDILYKS